MSKQLLVIVGVLAATFGAGIAIGFFLASDPSHSSVIAKNAGVGSTSNFFSDSAAQDREQNNALLSARIRELEKELTDPQQNRRAALADRLAFFKKYQKQISINPFSAQLEVSPEMVALLDLSPEETKTIEEHLVAARTELEKIQDANTVLSKQTANSVSYDIAADKQGDAIKSQLQTDLTNIMGKDRTDVFMGTNSYDYNTQLDGFTETKKQIELSWTGEGTKRVYTVRQNQFDANGNPRGSSSMSGSGMVQPEFQKYLPEGMKP